MFWIVLVILIVGLLSLLFFIKNKSWWIVCFKVLIVYTLITIVRTFIFDVFRVSSNSMENTLTKGDIILVNKLIYGPSIPLTIKSFLITEKNNNRFAGINQPERGDIVTFIRNNTIMVKRMIAIENDSIESLESGIYVNGKENDNKFAKRVFDVRINGSQLQEIRASSKFDFQVIKPAVSEVDSLYRLNLTTAEIHCLQNYNYPIIRSNINEISERVSRGGVYFVGDNRSFSTDSRTFGSVDKNNIIGKVNYVLYRPREKKFWDRFFCFVN